MTPGQAEVAESVLAEAAEIGPRFVAAHEAVVKATTERKALREQLIPLVRQAQAVGADMSKLAQRIGVTRQALYTWLK